MPRISGGYRRLSDADARFYHDSYFLLFDEAPYGIYRSTADGRFIEVNPALVRLLGYDSPEDLLAVDLARDVYLNPEDRGRCIRLAERAHEGDPARAWHTAEVPWRRKDGTEVTVRLSGTPLRDTGEHLTGFHMMVEDVTERRQLEERLRQSQKMEAVGQLTAGIAHDFNNLLTVILGNIGLIAEALPCDRVELLGDLAEVRNAARRGADMVRKLSAFGRHELLQRRLVSLATIVADSARLLRRMIPASVEVHTEVVEPLLAIQGDPAALEQIFLNLVTNACDAMPDGGTIGVDVRRRRLTAEDRLLHPWVEPGDYACLTVADSGRGMDQRTLNHIFEPFFTTKPRGEGTGLGMAMVYGLVKLHAGYIHVYSEEGSGTVVRLYFPIVREYPTRADDDATSAAQLPRGTETILLVEDDGHLLRAACRLLEKQGYRVLVATDGVHALETIRAQETEVALVVTDMVMPRMGGRQLFGALRAEGKTVPVLFTSGYSAGVVGEIIEDYGAVPFLGKPWTVEELLLKVRHVLDDAG